jgi:ectonucleotide pyrophosphatase/phosphodiesterase family protein 6
MVDNYMYDVIHNTEFLIGENPEQYDDYWWNDAEPLWIGAVRQVIIIGLCVECAQCAYDLC